MSWITALSTFLMEKIKGKSCSSRSRFYLLYTGRSLVAVLALVFSFFKPNEAQ
jgi:hypothetical protein